MEPRCKKVGSVADIGSRDRLSEMPDEVIVHILSFLPIVDAIRTVVLRRFGNLRTLVPSLSFDYQFYKALYVAKQRPKRWTWYAIALFIRNVLLLHRPLTLDEFKLVTHRHVCNRNLKLFDEVSMWLQTALGKDAKALDFEVYLSGSEEIGNPILPRCVFTSQSLVKLRLCGVEVECNHQVHLGSLRHLSLKSVRICDAAFRKLISGCPCLRELDVEDLVELVQLRFTNPSIEKLRLSLSRPVRSSLEVLDFPNLKKLDFDVFGCSPKILYVSSLHQVNIWHLESSDRTFLKMFQDIKDLTITPGAFCGLISSVKEMDVPENKWKRLVLHWACLKNHGHLLSICKLLTSSKHLEELVMFSPKLACLESNSRLNSSELSSCVMPHLKTVTIYGYESPNMIQYLIEFLLKSAVVLDELRVFQMAHPLTSVEEVKFLKQISSFQRASTKARVVFA